MSIFEYFSYGEITRLIVCIVLDVIEYVLPFLLTPVVGDLFDLIGIATCVYLFGRIGFVSVLELVPRFDVLPINIFTWVVWMLSRRWDDIMDMMQGFGFKF